jgi:hypothetical protein
VGAVLGDHGDAGKDEAEANRCDLGIRDVEMLKYFLPLHFEYSAEANRETTEVEDSSLFTIKRSNLKGHPSSYHRRQTPSYAKLLGVSDVPCRGSWDGPLLQL